MITMAATTTGRTLEVVLAVPAREDRRINVGPDETARAANHSRGWVSMYVGVIHRIHDHAGFEKAEQEAMAAGLPGGFSLPIHSVSPDGATGMCIWQGDSVDAVKGLVEAVVGDYSTNEYTELNVDGLPA